MESVKLKGNLYSLDNGYYISKNDPLFWKKLLNQRPEDKEALYHVGLEFEIEARKYLDRYYATKIDKFLALHEKLMSQAFDMVNRSFNKGFLPARLDILRMERTMKTTEKMNLQNNKNTKVSRYGVILLVIALILGIILGIILLPSKIENKTNYSNNHYTYMLPYEVIEKKPTTLTPTIGLNDQPLIIVINREISKDLLVNELVSRMKAEYKTNPVSAKQIVAIDETNTERGMAYWAGGDNNIQIYIYPSDSTTFVDVRERQLWETTTVLRSATYQFIKKNGYLPNNLEALIQPFPNNYLTDVPNDPYELKNTVTLSFTGEGGWLYSLEGNPSNKEWVSVVKEVVKPNIPFVREIPFSPLTILINKENCTLLVISGDEIIRKYSVALGKENSTPDGNLYISKKVMNPDKIVPINENVYGTRAMELSNMNFAIHGTNSPSSIGQEVSQGCIRLKNSDMEDLYSITPLYTPVKIVQNPTLTQGSLPLESPNNYLYNRADNLIEEDNLRMYHWAH